MYSRSKSVSSIEDFVGEDDALALPLTGNGVGRVVELVRVVIVGEVGLRSVVGVGGVLVDADVDVENDNVVLKVFRGSDEARVYAPR